MGMLVEVLQVAHYVPSVPTPAVAESRLTLDAGDTPAVQQLLVIDRLRKLDISAVPNPALVVITNRSGASEEVFPNEIRAAAIAASVLLVGTHQDACDLPVAPALPGFRAGGMVALPVRAKTSLWLRPESSTPVEISVLIVPGV